VIRWRFVLCIAVAALLVLGGAACRSSERASAGTSAAPTSSSPSEQPAPTASSTVDVPTTEESPAARFTGDWGAHTLVLTFDRAGHGTLLWRTYSTCGTDPPPCDTFRGNTVDSGGHATLLITKNSGTSATGQIVTSTDPAQLPAGPFSVRSAPHGMLMMNPSPRGDSPLCGPKTPVSACPY